jgi:hypothetical protein
VSESRLFELLTLVDTHSRHRLDKVASHIRLPKIDFQTALQTPQIVAFSDSLQSYPHIVRPSIECALFFVFRKRLTHLNSLANRFSPTHCVPDPFCERALKDKRLSSLIQPTQRRRFSPSSAPSTAATSVLHSNHVEKGGEQDSRFPQLATSLATLRRGTV